jgi:hypothetical protein
MIPNGYRFIGIAPEVDLKERGSALLNKRTEPFTLDEIRGYKVFTALLTQNGGDFGINNSTDDPYPFIIGVTYYIDENGDTAADFTNIGAPNNNVGTYFVATGTTPNSWGNGGYVNLRYNTGAPVATVLENTIGNVWFTYLQTGLYQANYDGLFTLNKTFGQGTTRTADDGTGFGVISVIPNNINTVNIYSTNPIVELPFDNILFNTPIEIRVYS